MTDDLAVEGEESGYVPCFELPAVLVVEEEGAISGQAGGRVPRDNAPGSLSAPEREAIVGSAVGYVAAPCEVETHFWNGYVGTRVLTASAMGGPTSVVSGPTYAFSVSLSAAWDSYDINTFGNMGDTELERRSFLSWLVPITAYAVRLRGTVVAQHTVTDSETNGQPQTTTVDYAMGPIFIDPDIPPIDFDNVGSGLDGAVDFLANFPVTGFGSAGQTPVDIDVISAALGATYVDVAGDVGPPGTTYRLFQLGIRNVSTVGLGRHSGAGGGPHDFEAIEILDRFPDNPNWHHGFTGPGFYTDYSQVESGILVDFTVTAFIS